MTTFKVTITKSLDSDFYGFPDDATDADIIAVLTEDDYLGSTIVSRGSSEICRPNSTSL